MNTLSRRLKGVIVILLFVTTLLHSQEELKVLKIDDTSLPTLGTTFKIIEIIDKRKIKDHIGYFQSGPLSCKIKYVNFERKLEEEIQSLIDKLIVPSTETPEEIVMFIHDLSISEWSNVKHTQSLLGHCVMDIEYLKFQDSNYLSLGRYITETEFSGLRMKKTHDKRIVTCLKDNVIKFMISNWKNAEGEIVQVNEEEHFFRDGTFPKAGLYYNFNSLLKNEPLEPLKYQLIPRDKNARNKRYQLAFKDKKNKEKRILFISDSLDLYLNSNLYANTESAGYPGSYFIKAKHFGKYIYFVDKLPKLVPSIAFGLTGATLSNYDRPMILDTSTGEFTILNEELFLNLISDYPELKYDYETSDKWTKDIEKIIVKLNEKLN